MTNYEKYKDDIEKLGNKRVAFDKFKNKIVKCAGFACDDCAFYRYYDDCKLGAMKWAAEEYKETEVDWSKVPVDTPVLISVDNKNWFNRYFAGVNEKGQPTVFCYGATQWSNGYEEPCHFKYIKLAEVSRNENSM